MATEDRQLFADQLKEIGEKIAPSFAVHTVRLIRQAILLVVFWMWMERLLYDNFRDRSVTRGQQSINVD